MKIQVLSKHVSDLIAAGEVVERPVSVVKELVENALDAGANYIVVETQRGGLASIRVTDNGSGIPSSDVETAFLRHATSKIQNAKDLESIATMGFRGEALSSIAAVSKIRLITRTEDVDEGVMLELEGGVIVDRQPVGCPVGTTFLVSDLFYNTPARLKFVKKDATEAGHISDLIDAMALAHPDVSFRLVQNGRESLHTAGDGDLQGTAYSVMGNDIAKHLLPVDYTSENMRISGLVGTGETCRTNRKSQLFFVNRRLVKSKLFYAAIDEAAQGVVVGKRYPVCMLNIELNPAQIDINVHPSKSEVKFSRENDVYHLMYWGIKNAFYQKPIVPEINLPGEAIAEEIRPQEKTPPVISHMPKTTVEKPPVPTFESKKENIKPIDKISSFFSVEAEQLPAILRSDPAPREERNLTPARTLESSVVVNDPEWRIVGQVFHTYIIAEKGEEMLIVDQHAAHERLKYEQLRKQEHAIISQELLQPLVLDFTKSEIVLLMQRAETFRALGFDFEEFGGNSIRFNRIPVSLTTSDVDSVIRELIDQLDAQRMVVESEFESRALFTIACKAAIKANQNLSEAEMKNLISDVLELGTINTCPHGRPITLKLTKRELEKHFKRIV